MQENVLFLHKYSFFASIGSIIIYLITCSLLYPNKKNHFIKKHLHNPKIFTTFAADIL